jgi:hypothetical protein
MLEILTAIAVTYLFSMIGLVLFITTPKAADAS